MSEKNDTRNRPGDGTSNTPLATRRAVLAAAGAVSLGSLAGCTALDRLSDRGGSEAVGTTSAAPAAAFAGVLADGPYPSRHSDTYRLAPAIRADAGPLSEDVELEGWVTTQVTTENYNSTRSNRSIAQPGDDDSDDDGIGDGSEIRDAALELERALLAETETAAESISKRSARTGPNPETDKPITESLGDMTGLISEIRATLESCSDNICTTVLENAESRKLLVQQAQNHVESGEWDHAAGAVNEVRDIVEGDIERLEDYNTTRSNRSAANPVDIIDDDVDEDDETFRDALELETQLQDAADRAVTSISKRSARTGRNPETGNEITAALDDMNGALSALRSVLERCSDESCVTALERVARMEAAVQNAGEHVENGAWDAAIRAIDGVGNDILVGDYLIATEDPPLDGEERAALGRYLTESPMVGERFTVCLPDAEIPGGNGSLAAAVTPQRFVDYMTGRAADGEGQVYAWGSNIRSAAGDTDDDEDDDTACADTASAGSGNELVCRANHLEADTSGPVSTGGSLDYTRLSDGTITVLNTPPKAEAGVSTLVCPVEGDAYEPSELSEWGPESGPSAETPTVVCQVLVQPPECPVPVPAMVYVKRCRSDQQLVYTGGWMLDTAALYRESATVLTIAGATQVVGVDIIVDDECCFDYNGAVSRLLSSELARRGTRVSGGPADSLSEYGVLPGAAVDVLGTIHPESSGPVFVTHTALDTPIVHLINARNASDAVKFKAGAELSKSVN